MAHPQQFPVVLVGVAYDYVVGFDGGQVPCGTSCTRCDWTQVVRMKQAGTLNTLTAQQVNVLVGVQWPPGSGTVPFPTQASVTIANVRTFAQSVLGRTGI